MRLFLILFFLSFAVTANAADDFTIVQSFAQELGAKNYDDARQYISSGSTSLFNKYSNYDLGAMTPQNFKLLSQTKNANFRYLKVSGNSNGRTGVINIAVVSENGEPKIDLPETARLGFGPNWQQKINMIEQSYLFARQNFGEQQSKQLLTNLLQKQR